MKLISRLFFVLFTFCSGLTYAQSVLIPPDLQVEKPVGDVPAACVNFSSESGWGGGKWSGVLPNHIWVEKINPDCTVKVVYAWGDAPSWRMAAGFERVQGTISDNQLHLVLRESNPKITATYTMSADGKSLSGVWQSVGNSTRTARIQLVRGPTL